MENLEARREVLVNSEGRREKLLWSWLIPPVLSIPVEHGVLVFFEVLVAAYIGNLLLSQVVIIQSVEVIAGGGIYGIDKGYGEVE